jgi:hypothetical protein
LKVTDPSGAFNKIVQKIAVGNEPPTIAWDLGGHNRSFYKPGTTINYQIQLSDKEDGSLASGAIQPSSVSATIDYLEEGFDMITHIQNNNIISNVPEPIKISLNSTLEIIEKINYVLNKIHNKIKNHSASYVKYVSKLNLSNEINELVSFDKIFDKRLGLLLEVLKIYSDVVK